MVRLSEALSMTLDSVVDYGSNLTASSEVPEGKPYVGTQERAWRPGRWRPRRHSCVGLLPRPPHLGLARFLGRLDRQPGRSEEHTSELQSPCNLVCRLLLEKKKTYHLCAIEEDLRSLRSSYFNILCFALTLLDPSMRVLSIYLSCHHTYFVYILSDAT